MNLDFKLDAKSAFYSVPFEIMVDQIRSGWWLLGGALFLSANQKRASFNPYGQILENSSRNISEMSVFRVMSRTVLLETSSRHDRLNKPGGWFAPKFLMDEFSSKTVFPKTEILEKKFWMSFPGFADKG